MDEKDELIKKLQADYEKQKKRHNVVIKRSDRQQLEMIKLNEKLDDYKKQLSTIVKETRLKQVSAINEYKTKILEKENSLNEKDKIIKHLQSELSTVKAANQLIQTKLAMQAERLGAKQKQYESNNVNNTKN